MTLRVEVEHGFGAGFALDVAFTAPSQGVTALFGPSGSGKSSVLAAVAGLLRPRRGVVELGGETLLDTARGLFVPPEHRRCAVVFQDARLFPHMSVGTNLQYGLSRAPAGEDGPGFKEVVELLGLAPLLPRRPRGLSGGERQRVALGRALLARPRLLLMDEPLASLDVPRRAEVLPFLARLARAARLPVLYVTHALDEVDALAGALVLLEGGRVRAAGSVEERSAFPAASCSCRCGRSRPARYCGCGFVRATWWSRWRRPRASPLETISPACWRASRRRGRRTRPSCSFAPARLRCWHASRRTAWRGSASRREWRCMRW